MTPTRDDSGSIALNTIYLVVILSVFVALGYDGSRLLTTRRDVISVAETAARTGVLQLSYNSARSGRPAIDTERARAAAQAVLDANHMSGTVTVTATTVTVTARRTHQHLLLRGGGSMEVEGTGTSRAAQGG